MRIVLYICTGNFANFIKRYFMEENCIVINGHCYVLSEPTESGSICAQCAFKSLCQEMVEFPLCFMLHGVDPGLQLIYVEKKL